MTASAPRATLECHLAEVHLEACTCPHKWKGLGVLYGISMGDGWVRMTDAEDCPVHGGSVRS
jgi:hypothetical protein